MSTFKYIFKKSTNPKLLSSRALKLCIFTVINKHLSYVLCFSFPPSVSVRAGWDLSSSSDCAASFLPRKKKKCERSHPKAYRAAGFKTGVLFKPLSKLGCV